MTKHEMKENSESLLNTFVLNLEWSTTDTLTNDHMELGSGNTGFLRLTNFP